MTALKKAMIALLACAVTATGVGIAVAGGDCGSGGERAAERFERLDADSSGSVTFAEFSAPMMKRFNEADADGDGLVAAEDVAATFDGRRAGRMARRMIEHFDIDGDDQVSAGELTSRQEDMFALLDRDDSGAVTGDELPHRFAGGPRFGRHGDRN